MVPGSGCRQRRGGGGVAVLSRMAKSGRAQLWAVVTGCAYADAMSVMREELHHLIDRLPEEQVAPMLALVKESLPVGEDGEGLWPLPSFAGALASGKGDVAARSQDILREEVGRDAG